MAARLKRLFYRSEIALFALVIVAVALSLLLGRWLAITQEPPTRQNVGERLLADGRADEAAHLFEDNLWKGVALYKSGRYQRAVGAFVTDDSITGYYNMGNAYAHLGLYEGAIAAYEVVLARVPNHEDARYNLDLVREAAKRERELEEEARDTEEAGNWEDGLIQEQQQADGTSEPAPENEDDQPSSDNTTEGGSDSDRVETSGAPPSSNGASGAQQDGQQLETTSLTLASGEEQENTSLSPNLDELQDQQVAPGRIDRVFEEELADEILLRRIEDDPALVLKARLSMALRKQAAGR